MTARPLGLGAGLRVVRGGLLAVSAATLAVATHGLAGGDAPDTGLTVLVCLAVAWVGTAVADRRHRPVVIVAGLGGSQLALHVVQAMPHEFTAHDHVPLVGGPGMLAAHIAAVVLTGLLLAVADTAVLAVVAALARVLPRLPFVVLVEVPARLSACAVVLADVVRDRLLSRIRPRRGPPARR